MIKAKRVSAVPMRETNWPAQMNRNVSTPSVGRRRSRRCSPIIVSLALVCSWYGLARRLLGRGQEPARSPRLQTAVTVARRAVAGGFERPKIDADHGVRMADWFGLGGCKAGRADVKACGCAHGFPLPNRIANRMSRPSQKKVERWSHAQHGLGSARDDIVRLYHSRAAVRVHLSMVDLWVLSGEPTWRGALAARRQGRGLGGRREGDRSA